MKIYKQLAIAAIVTAIGFISPAGVMTAQAADDISLTMTAEKEVKYVDKQGRKQIRYEKPKAAIPGDLIRYALAYENRGDEPAEKIVIVDPIPDDTVYIEGSAAGVGTEITFSIDGGKKFELPNELFVPLPKGKKRLALASEYTHIRWQRTDELDPGKKGHLVFKVRVK